ncbi:MAG: hypothetical protein ABR920_06795 [Terriglobales bacterium]
MTIRLRAGILGALLWFSVCFTCVSSARAQGVEARFVGDQKEIWTTPARLRFSDTEWLIPLSGIAGIAIQVARSFQTGA